VAPARKASAMDALRSSGVVSSIRNSASNVGEAVRRGVPSILLAPQPSPSMETLLPDEPVRGSRMGGASDFGADFSARPSSPSYGTIVNSGALRSSGRRAALSPNDMAVGTGRLQTLRTSAASVGSTLRSSANAIRQAILPESSNYAQLDDDDYQNDDIPIVLRPTTPLLGDSSNGRLRSSGGIRSSSNLSSSRMSWTQVADEDHE